MDTTNEFTHQAVTETPREDRSAFIKKLVDMGMRTSHGKPLDNEQEVGDVLGTLVQNKLLSAEDSYKMKDLLKNSDAFRKALSSRVERALGRKGHFSEVQFRELEKRIAALEQKLAV